MTPRNCRRRIAYAAIGWLGSAALAETLAFSHGDRGGSVAYTNSFTSFWLGICSMLLLCVIDRYRREEGIKSSLPAFVFSCLLSLSLVVGKQLETVEHWNAASLKGWIITGILSVYFTPFIHAAWVWLRDSYASGGCRENNAEDIGRPEVPGGRHLTVQEERRIWLRSWGVIFLCWIPVFLAFYPGAFVYDAQDEYVQVAARMFTTHHPLAHVLLLGGSVAAGNKLFSSFNTGIAVYTVCQMLLLSGVFAWTILYIRRKTKSKWGEILPVLFYGLFPVIPMYAVCSAKDGIFTAALLVVVIQMLSLFENPAAWLSKRRSWIAGILAATVMMLFRNNGVYAYFVWAVCALLFMTAYKYGKDCIRKMGLLVASALGLYLLISTSMAGILHATPGGKQELLTVPIQQMARVYAYAPETYSEEELSTLYEILPEEELSLYTPRISDLLKSKFNNENFAADPAKYLTLWIKTGLKTPMTYVNAWLLTSYGYWYPDSVINVYGGNTVHTYTYENSSYFGFETEPPGLRESKFPWLEEIYRNLSLELYQQKVPALSMLFSPAFLFWVYAFCMGYLLWQSRGSSSAAAAAKTGEGAIPETGSMNPPLQRLLPLLLIFCLWLTVLLGPTYLVRYVLILWFALPVFVTTVKV